jgi:hypothetical protein
LTAATRLTRFDIETPMKTRQKTLSGIKLMMLGFMLVPTTVSAEENPWTTSRMGPEESRNMSSDRNTWRDGTLDQSEDAVENSKYPPLDEDKALNIGVYSAPPVPQPSLSTPAQTSEDTSSTQQTYGGYPPVDYNRQYNYGNYPGYGYSTGPGYYGGAPWSGGMPGSGVGGYWPGSGYRGGGFPFGSRSGGFPFGDMPFWGGSGFW